jgi:nucleotidyltransferase substrate binding protein (TIGR01987 family)
LKDFLEYRGNRGIYGSKDATRAAFRLGLFENGDIWMDMIQSRNKTTHTYNEETVKEIVAAIKADYFTEFHKLQVTLTKLKEEEQSEL